MNFRDAKQLNPGDKVTIKKWKSEPEHIVAVTEVRVEENFVVVKCDDGRVYHHKSLKSVE